MSNKFKGVIKEIWPILILCGLVSLPPLLKDIDRQRCKREEKRAAQAFKPIVQERTKLLTDYVFNDVNTYVLQNKMPQHEINSWAKSKYASLQSTEKEIQRFVADSTQYADAIVRDIPFIAANICVYDKTIGKYEPLPSIRIAKEVTPDELCKAAADFIKKSEKFFPGSGFPVIPNENPAYKLKINTKYLKDISKDLADQRAIKAQIVRNLQKRGK